MLATVASVSQDFSVDGEVFSVDLHIVLKQGDDRSPELLAWGFITAATAEVRPASTMTSRKADTVFRQLMYQKNDMHHRFEE